MCTANCDHNHNEKKGGIGLLGGLFLGLLFLKLAGKTNLPWIWVLAPIWGPVVAVLVGSGVILLGIKFGIIGQ